VPEVGGDGWGNEELEYYTDSPRNAALDGNGNLVITAREDSSGGDCWYGPCRYTSARLITKGRFDQAYGRFEARIKLPRGQGIWPAFWMLGNDIGTVGWPASGEIDIMEYLGHEETVVHGSLHGPGLDTTDDYTAPHSFADDFHVFAVDWSPTAVTFLVDGHRYARQTRPPGHAGWKFDHPFFLLLNVAVGGRWPGSPDETTAFPQRMVVDYVRVYAPPE
jgi:beta-glucanase (GH16 family)